MNWSITRNKNWQSLNEAFAWVADMHGVVQDARHHAEGDVAIHTKMVLDSLLALQEFKTLDEQSREILWAAALMHDVEKRSTTVVESDGQITSRGHAKKGEFTTRHILFEDVATPFAIREKVCALVRHHGLPLWIMEKMNPVKAIIDASLRVDMPLLALIANADVRGRTCHDQREMLDRIELFAEYCREQKCWDGPRDFSSGLARFTFFQKENSAPDYVPYDDLKGEVIMLSGLPGMGKDTLIKKRYNDHPVISLDDIRRKYKLKPDDSSATGWVVQEAKEQAKIFLRKGQPFVWNATNISKQLRTQWIDLFTTYHARVKLIYLEVPYKEWLRQNAAREFPVPEKVLFKLLDKLEVPLLYEAHEVEYIV